MARSEWQDDNVVQGLMCDAHDDVSCATAATLFAVLGGQLCTSQLDKCGVARVARAEVLAQRPATRIRSIDLDELFGAVEIFLTSSVRGIVPVRESPDAKPHSGVGLQTRAQQQHWHSLGLVSAGFA